MPAQFPESDLKHSTRRAFCIKKEPNGRKKKHLEWKGKVPGGGTAVTALHTAQHTEVAPTGKSKRFRHPEHTSWLCAPAAHSINDINTNENHKICPTF